MNIFNKILRKRINKLNKLKLYNNSFSVISSNCIGGFILHDLGMRFNSPFINLWMKPGDFIKYLKNIEYYNKCNLSFIEEVGITYPVGILDDIKIYFQHFVSSKDALEKWEKRCKRIDFDNLFIIFTDRDGCTYQNLCDFDALPYRNKVVFTNRIYPEIKSSYYLKGYENEECIGLCFEFINKFSGRRVYDCFDFIKWFNQGS